MSTVADAVKSVTNDARVQLAMLFGAGMEGGLGPTFGVGDSGTSYGPWQIHLPAHPGVTAAQASDPTQAARFMLPSYQSAVAQVPQQLWTSDPEKAAEQAAMAAERPAQDYYTARGAAAVDASYQQAAGVLTGGAAAPSVTPALDINPLDGFGIPGAISKGAERVAGGILSWIEGWAVRVGLVLLGGLIVLVGLYITFSGASGGGKGDGGPETETETKESTDEHGNKTTTVTKRKAAPRARPAKAGPAVKAAGGGVKAEAGAAAKAAPEVAAAVA